MTPSTASDGPSAPEVPGPDGCGPDGGSPGGAERLGAGEGSTFEAMAPAPDLRWEDARELFADRLHWPLAATDVAVVVRLLGQGFEPTPEQWAELVEPMGEAVGWSTTTGRLEVLAQLVAEAGRIPAWMLHDAYGAARAAAPDDERGVTSGDQMRAARAAGTLMARVATHPDVGEATLSRIGQDVAEDDGTHDSGLDHLLRETVGKAGDPFGRAAFVRALMAGGRMRSPWRVMRHAPPPWPRRAFRRLAREQPELVARAIEEGPGAEGTRATPVYRVLERDLARDDLEPLLASDEAAVRAAGVRALGRLRDGAAAGDPAAGGGTGEGGGEAASEEAMARALSRGLFERYRQLGRAGGAVGPERARALYRALIEEGPIRRRDRQAIVRLLRAGHEPTRAQWARVLDPAHSAGEPEPGMKDHYAAVWRLLHEADPPAWMRLDAYAMARQPSAAICPEGWSTRDAGGSQATLIAAIVRQARAGEVVRSRLGHDVGRRRPLEERSDEVRRALMTLAEEGDEAPVYADPAFCRALVAGEWLVPLWRVIEHAPERWARVAFGTLARAWPEGVADHLLEPGEGPDNPVVARVLGVLTRSDLRPLLESEVARHRLAGVWALGRIEGRGGEGPRSAEVAETVGRGARGRDR